MVTEILTNFLLRMTQSGISIRLLVRFTKIISENYFIGILRGSEETEISWQVVWMEEGAKLFMKDCVKWLPNEWVQIQQGKEAGCCLTGCLSTVRATRRKETPQKTRSRQDGYFPSDACNDGKKQRRRRRAKRNYQICSQGQRRGRTQAVFQGQGRELGLTPLQKCQGAGRGQDGLSMDRRKNQKRKKLRCTEGDRRHLLFPWPILWFQLSRGMEQWIF